MSVLVGSGRRSRPTYWMIRLLNGRGTRGRGCRGLVGRSLRRGSCLWRARRQRSPGWICSVSWSSAARDSLGFWPPTSSTGVEPWSERPAVTGRGGLCAGTGRGPVALPGEFGDVATICWLRSGLLARARNTLVCGGFRDEANVVLVMGSRGGASGGGLAAGIWWRMGPQ